ncbi:rod shape-determining protein RodA [Vulcanimicrobium alpinum]|uniref:Rod shape-determining protein RodA n=1 Tax=Vulcanimicrobium alpinum TaxID=3016050 RepID=A0AAN1XS35_UNVUL|nr:rod shape-determining protein RodA [Vulcanimicrobium alpinum]BDE04774.1 rod shape-determining protein RodA [Vulcanimicrobium alpinum]
MERPWYTRFNWPLAILPILTTVYGIVFIRSATLHDRSAASEWRSQMLYAAVGIVLMIGVAFVDYRVWRRWALPMYVVTLGLLAFITFKGHEALGAARWIKIGSFTFQPSEPAKLVLAITIAALLCRGSYRKIQELWLPLVAVAVPAVLILKQPDLGTTLVIGAIFTAELYFGLPNLFDFGLYVGGVAAAAAYVLTSEKILKPFQRARLTVFLDPKVDPQGVGYNLNQSKIAVGSGEWFGKGLFHGTQTQLAFVPENSRDFIFTAVGEETGFVGAALLLALYAATIGFAMRSVFAAKDRFGVLLSVGLVAMLAFHIVVNVGMTIGIMPITGIPLPFMSYGGSALMTDYIAVGMLLNIVLQKDKLVFGDSTVRRA